MFTSLSPKCSGTKRPQKIEKCKKNHQNCHWTILTLAPLIVWRKKSLTTYTENDFFKVKMRTYSKVTDIDEKE